jgi:hypothetical protein
VYLTWFDGEVGRRAARFALLWRAGLRRGSSERAMFGAMAAAVSSAMLTLASSKPPGLLSACAWLHPQFTENLHTMHAIQRGNTCSTPMASPRASRIGTAMTERVA